MIGIKVQVGIIKCSQNARFSEGIAAMHPGIRYTQAVGSNKIKVPIDLGQAGFEDGTTPAGVVQKTGNTLGVVLDDELGAVAIREFDAVRFDRVNILGGSQLTNG